MANLQSSSSSTFVLMLWFWLVLMLCSSVVFVLWSSVVFVLWSSFVFVLWSSVVFVLWSSVVFVLCSSVVFVLWSSFVFVPCSSSDTLVLTLPVSGSVGMDTDVVVTPLIACFNNKKNHAFEFAILVYHIRQVVSFLIYFSVVRFLSRLRAHLEARMLVSPHSICHYLHMLGKGILSVETHGYRNR